MDAKTAPQRDNIAGDLTVREAAVRLKVSKTAPYEALAGELAARMKVFGEGAPMVPPGLSGKDAVGVER